ncbi:hypothetical protein G5714_010339 [Onychostoma macrolepis]|uniref:Uncharacterized protein n=1 Tax=Onychostoma macrolepis TaxID=369639 RepID=A0A7J6CPX6_9TELE|nr:hypothetical protein G5714_010339 [Onychostoma macrolepis]
MSPPDLGFLIPKKVTRVRFPADVHRARRPSSSHLIRMLESLQETMRYLESQCLEEIEVMLRGEMQGQELRDLFFDCVDAEIKFCQ